MKEYGLILLTVLASQVCSAPQLISFKDGKLGVNLGGYHAGVGLGGVLGDGASGGLFAEVGTPHGQAAKAGLGGAVNGNTATSGGLYAGATAGGSIKTETRIGGGVVAEKAAGAGFGTAQSGNHYATSGLGGGAFGSSLGVTKEIQAVQPVYTDVDKKLHKEINVEAINEVKPVLIETEPQPPVVVKEVLVQKPIVQKTVIRTHKPRRHRLHKTAYIGGYVGATDVPQPASPTEILSYQPAIQKRVDYSKEVYDAANAKAAAAAETSSSGQVAYTKQVSFQRNPNFFADIFNIPISTLKAVGNFLGNTAGSANLSIQKTASVQADRAPLTAKYGPTPSETHSVSVDKPSASKFIDDIFSIPINTLGAVSRFLENNVAARKNAKITPGAVGEPTPVRLGPLSRRKAN